MLLALSKQLQTRELTLYTVTLTTSLLSLSPCPCPKYLIYFPRGWLLAGVMSPFKCYFFSGSNYSQKEEEKNTERDNKSMREVKSSEQPNLAVENCSSPGSGLPAARSLPILTGSRRWSSCEETEDQAQEEEEEVFSLSLETDLDTTTSSSCLETENSAGTFNFSRLVSPLAALQQDGRKSRPSLTPGSSRDGKRKRLVSPSAPKKHKNRGRAEQLQRYIHKYDCEDLMEYAVDTYHWKLSLEESYQAGNWLLTQLEITPSMRFSLLEWLVRVTRVLDFSLETWCLAVNYVDRFLCTQLIAKDCLQLVGLTALWLGAKQEELLPPSLEQLVALCADSVTSLNIKHMELLILAKLKFRLTAPTAAYHLHHLIAVEEEKDWSEDLARHLVEVIMEDHVLARERPSKIAHAVYHAIKEFDLTAVQILESSCPRCEPRQPRQPHQEEIWSHEEELFQMCLQRVLWALGYTKSASQY